MTSRKRLVLSYCCLALLLAVLFAVSLFWGSVAELLNLGNSS